MHLLLVHWTTSNVSVITSVSHSAGHMCRYIFKTNLFYMQQDCIVHTNLEEISV